MDNYTLNSTGKLGGPSLALAGGSRLAIPNCFVFDDNSKLDFVVDGQQARVRLTKPCDNRPVQGVVMHTGSPSSSVRVIAEAITYCILEGAVTVQAFQVPGFAGQLKSQEARK